MLTRRRLVKSAFGAALASTTAIKPASAWLRGNPFYNSPTQQFFDRLITPPTAARAALYNNLISSLVSAGVWSFLDVLAIYAAADSGTSFINLVQGAFTASIDEASGDPTFTPNVGWSGGQAYDNDDINTNFNPSTASGNYTQNNAMFCLWQIGAAQSSAAILIGSGGSPDIALYPEAPSTTNATWEINGNGSDITIPNLGTPAGFWLAQRTASNACALYQNGSLLGSSSNVSASPPSANIDAAAETLSSGNTVAAVGFGAALTGAQISALYNALQAYLTAVGAI